jgi:DNA-directed RNA polymerase sigma subunit (sigma70/sigma32)
VTQPVPCNHQRRAGRESGESAVEYLDPREQQIMRMRAGLQGGSNPKTLEEIRQELGITKERVHQRNVLILNKLRSIAREQASAVRRKSSPGR